MEYLIKINKSKFTEEDLNELESYRQLAISIKLLYRRFEMLQIDSKTKKERDGWEKCIDLLDEMRCVYDGELFDRFPQLPDKAVHVFY